MRHKDTGPHPGGPYVHLGHRAGQPAGQDLGLKIQIWKISPSESPNRVPVVEGVTGGADEHLIGEAEKIAVALGRTFPRLCEVVLHDLRDPPHAIRMIENSLSGRRVGAPRPNRPEPCAAPNPPKDRT
jgi:YheO-like PAS domain